MLEQRTKGQAWTLALWLLLAGVVIVTIMGTIGLSISGAVSQQRLSREIAKVRQRGEPIYFADIKPTADADSYARGARLKAALAQVPGPSDEAMNLLASEQLVVGDNAPLAEALELNRTALEDVAAILAAGPCRFEYDFSHGDPYSLLLEHVQQLRGVGRLHGMDVIQSLGTNRPRDAAQAVMRALDTTEALRHDPFLVSQLVRRAMGESAIASLERLLGHAAIDEAGLLAIDGRLAEMEASFRLREGIILERAVMMTYADRFGSQGSLGGIEINAAQRLWWSSPLYTPSRRDVQALALAQYSHIASAIDGVDADSLARFAAAQDRLEQAAGEDRLLALLMVAFDPARNAAMQYRQQLINARLALRVDRYYRSEGRLPAALDEVLDDALTEIGPGYVSRQPIVYEAYENGFAIYDDAPLGDKDRAAEVRVEYRRSGATSTE